MSEIKIIGQDYHRNGTGGNGFHVAIIEDPEHGRMLVVDFAIKAQGWKDAGYGDIAVLNLDMASEGNVYMFPENGQAGGNAWRGPDLGSKYRPLMRTEADRQHDELIESLRNR